MPEWIPLESNPDVLNKYIFKMGVPKKWAISDVMSLEEEMLDLIPKPVKALILLFPHSETYEKYRDEEAKRLRESPQPDPHAELYFMRQTTDNTCGPIALIHSIANCDEIYLVEGPLKDFIEYSRVLSPDERPVALDKQFKLHSDHQALAEAGQTTPNSEAASFHFVTFLPFNNVLYELDGKKEVPISHGQTSEESFLEDAISVCRDIIARDPNELYFTIMTLGPNENI